MKLLVYKLLVALGMLSAVVGGAARLGGAPPAEVIVPTKEYPKGTVTDTPTYDVPDGPVCMYVGLARENWTDTGEGKNVVEVYETFFDGQDWLSEALLFKADGGIRKDKDGQTLPEGSWEGGIGDGKGRKIIIRTKALENINSTITVKFSLCL